MIKKTTKAGESNSMSARQRIERQSAVHCSENKTPLAGGSEGKVQSARQSMANPFRALKLLGISAQFFVAKRSLAPRVSSPAGNSRSAANGSNAAISKAHCGHAY